jgi:hypothetical protein
MMPKETIIILCFGLYLLSVYPFQAYARKYWKRTTHFRFEWPREIIVAHRLDDVWIWCNVAALFLWAGWRPATRLEEFYFYSGMLYCVYSVYKATKELGAKYKRWRSWIAQPSYPNDQDWTFFLFGMDRDEADDVFSHDPDARVDAMKRARETYEQTGVVRIPEPDQTEARRERVVTRKITVATANAG